MKNLFMDHLIPNDEGLFMGPMRLLEGSMRSFTGQIRSLRGSFGLPEVLHGSLVGRSCHKKTKCGHNSFI